MRHPISLVIILLSLGMASIGRSADAYSVAQRQEAEEQARRVNAKLNSLEEALQAYQHEITVLKAEIRGLREEMARSQNRGENSASQESIKQLAASIQEVDRKRIAGDQSILAELAKLGASAPKTVKPSKAERPPAPSTGNTPPPRVPSDKDLEYSIRSKDTLIEIVKALNEQGVKVTRTDIEKANPKVNWNNLQVNQKIIIPAPAP